MKDKEGHVLVYVSTRAQGQLTNDLDEICQDDPIPQILPQVLHRLHRWPLLQLCVHPGHVCLQLLLENERWK